MDEVNKRIPEFGKGLGFQRAGPVRPISPALVPDLSPGLSSDPSMPCWRLAPLRAPGGATLAGYISDSASRRTSGLANVQTFPQALPRPVAP